MQLSGLFLNLLLPGPIEVFLGPQWDTPPKFSYYSRKAIRYINDWAESMECGGVFLFFS